VIIKIIQDCQTFKTFCYDIEDFYRQHLIADNIRGRNADRNFDWESGFTKEINVQP
jgi:hypothetical protein